MRELLKAAETVVDEYKGVPSSHFHSLLVKLEEAIAAAKERSKWHKIADGLPVVPEGEQRVAVWVCCSNEVLPEMFWSSDGKWWGFEKYGFTHWQYRQDDTPAPPEEA